MVGISRVAAIIDRHKISCLWYRKFFSTEPQHHNRKFSYNKNDPVHQHELEYRLVVTETDTVKDDVKSVSCQFHAFYGRDEGQIEKRKR